MLARNITIVYLFVVTLLPALIISCTSTGNFNTQQALNIGSDLVQASLLDEQSVIKAASLSAKEYDQKHKIPPANNAYAKRLHRLTQGLGNVDGLKLNFQVYLSKEINAFAMADGTIRVYSGLMDAMPDDQVLAVIGHEIGHVKLKHTYNQLREQLIANAAFKTAISVGGTLGKLTSSQLGQLAYAAVNARFSQQDELDADVYAIKFLHQRGQDPAAMRRSIETLQHKHGSGGGFLSSHPSNNKRISNIDSAISTL